MSHNKREGAHKYDSIEHLIAALNEIIPRYFFRVQKITRLSQVSILINIITRRDHPRTILEPSFFAASAFSSRLQDRTTWRRQETLSIKVGAIASIHSRICLMLSRLNTCAPLTKVPSHRSYPHHLA